MKHQDLLFDEALLPRIYVQPDAEPTIEPELESYDRFLVMFSGGKDSQACVLHLLERGVPPEKIELWHHDIDGREGSRLMDWPVTRAYCVAFARAFGLAIYFSWKEGGFEGEMLRENRPTARTLYEVPDDDGRVDVRAGGGKGPFNTRLKFPQVSADLAVRWCSSLKIDGGAMALRNQERFLNKQTLVLTGERAQESSARAKYKAFEPHRTDNRDGRDARRHVDHWRPVHRWDEKKVWAIIERFRVNPHPAYRLGWGRLSCAACIFGSANQWASVRAVNPEQFERIAGYEERFGLTIQRSLNVRQLADKGCAYDMSETDKRAALAETFDEPIILPPGQWQLPAGAFGESTGPV